MIFGVYGTMFAQKTKIEPLKKAQKIILQQSDKFRSRYVNSQPMSALSYKMHVAFLIQCSLYTRLLLVKNVDFTFWSSNLVYNLFLLALVW